MKVGVLTGGGDCPGLNAVIRAVVRRGDELGLEVMGLREGWRGLYEGTSAYTQRLTRASVSGILHIGGTILGTSRTNPLKKADGEARVLDNMRQLNLGALIAIGGEDTLGVANKLSQKGLPVVGVPKTIDNDLSGTDFTFGFDTAVSIATEAIDRLHSTAESHKRVMVCEVMGRHAGWIATYSGLAGGADVILIPENPVNLEEVAETIRRRHARGKNFSIVVVAEGARIARLAAKSVSDKTSEPAGRRPTSIDEVGTAAGGGEVPRVDDSTINAGLDEFGHVRLGGVGAYLATELEKRTGFETRVTVLGHIQRGGSPTAHDRVLATRFGVKAAELVAAGDFGKMAALRGNEIVAIPLGEAVKELKTVDPKLFALAKTFFG